MSAIVDIFNCVQYTQAEKLIPIDILSLIDEIFNNPLNKINWDKYLHIFYTNKYKIIPRYPDNIQNNIKKILGAKNSDINNFLTLDTIFKNINDLNSSYNQSINKTNYTILRLQDNYIEYILNSDNTDLLNHWFRGISNNIMLELYDGIHKSKYHRTIMILKKYLRLQYQSYNEYIKRNSNIGKFYIEYGKFVANELISKYNDGMISIKTIFSKLQEIEKKNEILMDNMNFGKNIFSKTIIYQLVNNCWEKHIDTETIDEDFLSCITSISLQNTKYNEVNIKFINKWYLNIKDKINLTNFKDMLLFNDIIKVLPILKYNNGFNYSKDIDIYFRKLFNIHSDFLEYIMSNLNIMTISYKTIKSVLSLISLHENKNILWGVYFKNLSNRLYSYGKCHVQNILDNMISNEYLMFNYLVNKENNNISNEYLNKTRIMLDNFANSIKHNKNLHLCKIDFVDNLNNNVDINNNIIDKVNYIVFDKNITDNTNSYQLIDKNKYSFELNMALKIGEYYYKNVSEIYNYEWDIQNSYIDFTINSTIVSSSIIEYIIIKTIMENKYNLSELLNKIVNREHDSEFCDRNKKYLSSYVKNLINVDLISYNDDILTISKNISDKHINITEFRPYIVDFSVVNNLNKISEDKKDTKVDNQKDEEKQQINKECIVYLRSLFLTKIFKRNSTVIFNFDKIIEELNKFVNKELSSKKYSEELINIFKQVANVQKNCLINELDSLEKRNIIEISKINSNYKLYSYFV
jgi:hypothetical protein